MATMVTIARTTRKRLRLDRTSIDTVAAGGTSVDVEDPAIRRDMNRTVGQWVILTDAIDDGSAVRNVINNTGGNLTAGQLVYISGWDETAGVPEITKADADASAATVADYVLREDIDNGDEGQVFTTHRLEEVDTDGSSEGDPVYLSAATAGAWTATAPSGGDDVVQVVGHVAVADDVAGVVELNVENTPDKIALNQISGLTATVAELNETDDMTSHAQSTIAVAAEAGESIAVTVTLKDAAGVAVDEARVVNCWLSSSATTGAVAVDDTITVTASTGSLLVEHTDDLIFKAVTSTAGVLVLDVAHAGNSTAKYLWVEFPNGKCKVSAAIDLA